MVSAGGIAAAMTQNEAFQPYHKGDRGADFAELSICVQIF